MLQDKKFEKFWNNFDKLKNSTDNPRFLMDKEIIWMCLDDDTKSTPFDRHYMYHTAWAARILKQINPEKHFDISSFIYFVTTVSAFIPISFYDYRPAYISLPNFESNHADITNLPFEDKSIKSLSCMHVVEHIGLARYGDPLDYDGDLKAISELKRVLANNGDLLFVVPIGCESRIYYNAHRVYTKKQILEYFSDLQLQEFALIPERNIKGLIYNPGDEIINESKYACGCFWFKKMRSS